MGKTFTAAAVQAAYVLMDREATTDKVVELIGKAATEGAALIVFPEVFVPGTPIWIDSGSGLGRRRSLVRPPRRPGGRRAKPDH